MLTLIVAGWFALQFQPVQQFFAQKATVFLSSKLKTKVTIGGFTTDWQNSIVLNEIYLEDKNRDTLLYAGKLGLDLNIFGMNSNRLKIRSVRIEDGKLHINRNP